MRSTRVNFFVFTGSFLFFESKFTWICLFLLFFHLRGLSSFSYLNILAFLPSFECGRLVYWLFLLSKFLFLRLPLLSALIQEQPPPLWVRVWLILIYLFVDGIEYLSVESVVCFWRYFTCYFVYSLVFQKCLKDIKQSEFHYYYEEWSGRTIFSTVWLPKDIIWRKQCQIVIIIFKKFPEKQFS